MTANCLVLSTALLYVVSSAFAQKVPAGWKTIIDLRRLCQVDVPPDWTTSPFGIANAPARKAVVTIASVNKGSTWDKERALQKQTYLSGYPLEETKDRLWYSLTGDMQPNAAQPAYWRVAVRAGSGYCTANISFTDSSLEDTAKKIAQSLSPAKQITTVRSR